MSPDPSHRPTSNIRPLLLAFSLALLIATCWFARHAILIIYISAIFAIVLTPAIDKLHATKLFGWQPGRGTALLLLILLVCILLGGLATFAILSMHDLPGFSEIIRRSAAELRNRFPWLPAPGDIDIAKPAAALVPRVTSAITDILTGILLTAYLILDGRNLYQRSLYLAPPQHRQRLNQTLSRASLRMRHWLAGQGMLMAILGSASAVVFGLMRLPYFYLLAVFAGIANIVPLLGPLATVLVASAVAATQSKWDVLGVLAFYFIYQQVENAFLTPAIMKSQVQISSSLIVIALLVGGELAGIPGVLVAVPSAVLVGELVSEYLMWQNKPSDTV